MMVVKWKVVLVGNCVRCGRFVLMMVVILG